MMLSRFTIPLAGLALALAACAGGADECFLDSDCPAGRYCRDGDCFFDCALDRDCHDGYRCTIRGRCEPGCARTNNGVEACDGLATTCDGPQPEPDDTACDGLDSDCDGLTDEDATERDCPLQQGLCAGARETCLGVDGWSGCDYGPEYTLDEDANCDQIDEDCDGLTDEDAPTVLVPEVGVQGVDGIDNNCNGLIDEAGGVMVPVAGRDGVWIDSYEATVWEQHSCSGQRYGAASDDYPADWPPEGAQGVTLYACSLPGLVPSGHLSWYRAREACAAQGKRLCTSDEFLIACPGGGAIRYPYGDAFVPGTCNDAFGGWGAPARTGSFDGCTADGLTFDMSGNLNEWLAHWDPDGECAGCAQSVGSGFTCELCDWGLDCHDCDLDDPNDFYRIERAYDCAGTGQRDYEIFDRLDTRAFQGVRCCFDSP